MCFVCGTELCGTQSRERTAGQCQVLEVLVAMHVLAHAHRAGRLQHQRLPEIHHHRVLSAPLLKHDAEHDTSHCRGRVAAGAASNSLLEVQVMTMGLTQAAACHSHEVAVVHDAPAAPDHELLQRELVARDRTTDLAQSAAGLLHPAHPAHREPMEPNETKACTAGTSQGWSGRCWLIARRIPCVDN